MNYLDNPQENEKSRAQYSAEKTKKRELNKQKWFQYFVELAKKNGGKVLSTEYERMHSKMTFQCKQGHVFEAKCHDVRQKGTWCSECAGNKRLTVDKLRESAARNGGILFSQAYIGLDVDHVWACSHGHQFSLTPLNVLHNNAWCPICSKEKQKKKRREKLLAKLQKAAQIHNGKLLSREYINSRTAVEFECEHGHKFSKTPEKINKGEWCPECKK